MYSPMAGELVRPGDSMPAQSKKNGASSGSPRMNSWLSSWARSPAKEVITWRTGALVTYMEDFFRISSNPSCVVATASLSSISIAVGPTSVFPWMVGATRMPLPSFVGCGKMVCFTKPPVVLSSRK